MKEASLLLGKPMDISEEKNRAFGTLPDLTDPG